MPCNSFKAGETRQEMSPNGVKEVGSILAWAGGADAEHARGLRPTPKSKQSQITRKSRYNLFYFE